MVLRWEGDNLVGRVTGAEEEVKGKKGKTGQGLGATADEPTRTWSLRAGQRDSQANPTAASCVGRGPEPWACPLCLLVICRLGVRVTYHCCAR